MLNDKRYTITREYTGSLIMMLVVRFCNNWVGSSQTQRGAIDIMNKHNANR